MFFGEEGRQNASPDAVFFGSMDTPARGMFKSFSTCRLFCQVAIKLEKVVVLEYGSDPRNEMKPLPFHGTAVVTAAVGIIT